MDDPAGHAVGEVTPDQPNAPRSPSTLIAVRISSPQWLTDQPFDALLQFLNRHPGVVDEVAYYTNVTHAPLPMDELERRLPRLQSVLEQTKERGYRAGVNVMATIGHKEEALPQSLAKPWRLMTDPSGKTSRGSYCPSSEEIHGYIDELYARIAALTPDFIWVDDDVRLRIHSPIVFGCFCDECISRFNSETAAGFTREALVAVLVGPVSVKRDEWRRQWLAYNGERIAGVLRSAEQAAHRVNPAIELGFMTGDRFYEGYAFDDWVTALRGPDAGAVRWRPGGGFYSDDSYLGMVDKAHWIGRQASQLPDYVRVIQAEVENFPYQTLRKSATATALEAAAHVAAGAAGVVFNILGQRKDPLDEFEPLLDRIAEARPFFDAIQAAAGRGPALGVWPAWNRDVFADVSVPGDWPAASRNVASLYREYVLAELGLPVAYGPEGACMTLLSGALPASFSVEQLEQIFRGGVFMDGSALQTLEMLGVPEWAGVRVVGTVDHDAVEVLGDHPLNGSFAGWERDSRQSFWPQPAYQLAPTSPDTEVLASLVDYGGAPLGPTMTAYENALGGRVVVAGYFPWTLTHTRAKVAQLKAICDWCSRSALPAVVESHAKVVLWVRAHVGGGVALVVLNASLDPLHDLVLQVRSRAEVFEYRGMDGNLHLVPTEGIGEEHVRIRLAELAPWHMCLLTAQTLGVSENRNAP